MRAVVPPEYAPHFPEQQHLNPLPYRANPAPRQPHRRAPGGAVFPYSNHGESPGVRGRHGRRRNVADAPRLTEQFPRFRAHDRLAVALCTPYRRYEQDHVENKARDPCRVLGPPRGGGAFPA